MHCLGRFTRRILLRRSRTPVIAVAFATLALAVAAGCGSEPDSSSGAPRGDAALKGDPALARAAKKPGEIVLRASASPKTHGPIALDGRYTVRFEQYAPEDPSMDFMTQTAFVAALQKPDGRPAERLFSAARASGSKTITAHGRFLVDVSFGDFPYVLRFSPAAG